MNIVSKFVWFALFIVVIGGGATYWVLSNSNPVPNGVPVAQNIQDDTVKPIETPSAKNTPTQTPAPTTHWIAFSSLPAIPASTKVYKIFSEKTGSTTVVSWDGSVPAGAENTPLSPKDPNYPNSTGLRIFAFLHDKTGFGFLPGLPAGIDVSSLEVSITKNFIKDAHGVYILSCGVLSCGYYDRLQDVDVATFKETTNTSYGPDVALAKDKNKIYTCTFGDPSKCVPTSN